ncbi:oligosaccharide flippase family protein [Mesorhizobium sp. VNQ89]|uniref:lipopolysaccharide biosynthesis protein n=1 Tax=Mesorhizobium quangtriensis TaxID=3157709 RepID=UPI0032B80C2B
MADVSAAPGSRVSRRTVTDTAWAMFGLGGPTLLQLLYVIAAARGLGAEQFGQLMLCVAVATVAGCIVGIGGDGVAFKAIARTQEAANSLFGMALTMILITAVPVAICAVLLAVWLQRFDIPLWLPVAIVVSEVLFNRIASACQKVFIAFSQQLKAALVGMFVPLARLASAAVVLLMSPDDALGTFATAYLVSTFVAMVACILYTVVNAARPKFGFSGMKLGEGVSFALLWVNASLQVEADKMILSYFATPAAVGVYSLASRLMDGAFNPPRALRISLQARMMREGAKGHSATYRFMLRILPISVAYGIFAWGAIAVISPMLVRLFGEEYAELGRILPLMGALPLLRSIADIGAELFIASDRVSLSTIVHIVSTALRIGIGIVLIRSDGIDGAVGAALLSTTLAAIIFWTIAFVMHRKGAAGRQGTSSQPPDDQPHI